MKKALVAILILWAGPALAQESYTLNATAGNITNFIDPGRVSYNEQACNAAALPLTCTEAQLQAVEGHETDRIYPDSQAGRQDYVVQVILQPRIPEIRNDMRRWDRIKAQLAWAGFNRTQKDAVCSALGLPAGCELY